MQVWRPVCGPVSERKNDDAVERFSATQAAGVRARDADRPVRPVLRAAVRARLRHHHRQRPAPRAAVVDRRRGDHRREDRRRAARVLADPGRGRGRHRHHPQPEADSAEAARRRDQDADRSASTRPGEVLGARHPGRRRRRDPRAGRAHRDRRRGRQAPHGDAHEARPRLRLGRQELRRRPRHRLDPDRLGPLAGQEGQLPGRGGAPRPDDRLRQADHRRLDQRLDQRRATPCRWPRS